MNRSNIDNAVAVAERRGRLTAEIETCRKRQQHLESIIAATRIELANAEATLAKHLENQPSEVHR
jgi:hypothetical protein